MKCPCEDCISYAICNVKDKIRCNDLWMYLVNHKALLDTLLVDRICNCRAMIMFNAYGIFMYQSGDVKFIKDKAVIDEFIHRCTNNIAVTFPMPIIIRQRRFTIFWLYKGVLGVIGIYKKIVKGLKTRL